MKLKAKHLSWLPLVPKEITDAKQVMPMEPIIRPLHRMGHYDKAIRTTQRICCCDCGLEHLFHYEVYKDESGQFFINIRATADDRTGLRGKKLRKRKSHA
jgi:hypothetical protein